MRSEWHTNPRLYLGYDALDRLHTVCKGSATATPDVRYIWNGNQLARELEGNGAFRRFYVYGPGTDEVVGTWATDRPGNVELYHADERGSVVGVTDRWGANVARTGYGEYGETPDVVWPTPFGYTGQVYLRDARLYHYKARAYDPEAGRFAQTDPIGTAGGINLYGYVGGDPVNWTDPLGMERRNQYIVPVNPWNHNGSGEIHVPGDRCRVTICHSYALQDALAAVERLSNLPNFNPGGEAGGGGGGEGQPPPPRCRRTQFSRTANTLSGLLGNASAGSAVAAVLTAPTAVGAASFQHGGGHNWGGRP